MYMYGCKWRSVSVHAFILAVIMNAFLMFCWNLVNLYTRTNTSTQSNECIGKHLQYEHFRYIQSHIYALRVLHSSEMHKLSRCKWICLNIFKCIRSKANNFCSYLIDIVTKFELIHISIKSSHCSSWRKRKRKWRNHFNWRIKLLCFRFIHCGQRTRRASSRKFTIDWFM